MQNSNQGEIIEKALFSYSSFGKSFEKHTAKQVGALKYFDLLNKKDEFKQTEDTFLQNLMDDLIRVKLKEIVKMQNTI